MKSNCKKAMENVKEYIMRNFDCSDYDQYTEPDSFEGAAVIIYDCFINEKRYDLNSRFGSEYMIFEDWCRGLPSILDTCYFYNRSAVTDLGDILEETPEERARFSEEQAEQKLTYMIYRAIDRARKEW